MIEKLEITKENAIAAYKKGNIDVKIFLVNLFGKEIFEEKNKFVAFIDTPEGEFRTRVLSGELSDSVVIGKRTVPIKYRGRCLLLLDGCKYNWKIIDHEGDKLLICEAKNDTNE